MTAFLTLATTSTQAAPYELTATFAIVMLLSALVLVVFMRPGAMARMVVSIPFSLFILAVADIPLQAATGFSLIDFTMAEAPGVFTSTLRLAAELLCYIAAWKSVPWLCIGKDALSDLAVRLLTQR